MPLTAKDQITEADALAVIEWRRLRTEIETLKAQLSTSDGGDYIALKGEIAVLERRLARGPIIPTEGTTP